MPFATNMNVPQIFGTEPGKEFSLFSPQENKVYKFIPKDCGKQCFYMVFNLMIYTCVLVNNDPLWYELNCNQLRKILLSY